jgi:arylformamidase
VINSEALLASGFNSGVERLILKTQNTEYWIRDPYGFHGDYIGIDTEGAEFLVSQGVKLVGVDYFSASPMNDLVRPHEILLEAGVVILENAYLVDVLAGEYQLVCLPLKLQGTDGAPVRAILTH